MELELQKERFDCYRPGAPLALTREETAETVVPDYSPDIARIVDVSACLLLRSRTVSDGALTLAGTVRLTLLFLAEDTPGLRSLEYSVPFEQSVELPEGCADAAAEGRACGVEARLLNPRKLFTRMDLVWRITPYCQTVLTTCGAIPDQAAYMIETRVQTREVSLIRSIGSKDFVFSEELTPPSGRAPIRELLRSRVALRVTEARSIGSKAILKGVACVSLLYAGEDGKLCSYAEELPFSQILDGVAEERKDALVSAALSLSGCEIHTGGESGGAVSVKLFLSVFYTVRTRETVSCITDLYSTAYALDAQMERIELWQEPELASVTQNVREQLDTGAEVKNVLCADVCFGAVAVRWEDGRALLRADAAVSVLYLDEADVPLAVERRIAVTAEADADADAGVQADVESVCAGDISANINVGGVELRFPAEFRMISAAAPTCECLVSLNVGEPMSKSESLPSLVLRALGKDETLWDVAKQYRTTVAEILSANELAEEAAVEAGRMLLIPRKR